jgi:hypothetical protein
MECFVPEALSMVLTPEEKEDDGRLLQRKQGMKLVK